jgi:glycosyltransferase involved in cell wall biosynthesis
LADRNFANASARSGPLRTPASFARLPVLRRWTPTIGARLEAFRASAARGLDELPPRPVGWRRRIEVVVPAYNHAEYLPEAYASLLEQTWREPIAVTFVDDRSSDRTPELLAEIQRSHPRDRFAVKVITNRRNRRQWGSINRAVEASENDLIVILNDDDVLMPDCLEKVVATYEAAPNIYMLGGSSTWISDRQPRSARPAEPLEALELRRFGPVDALRYRELNDLNLTHSSSSFFKVAWRAVGGYYPKRKRVHPQANEDRDFQMRVSALFPVGVYVDYPLAYWRTDSSHGQSY